MLVKTRAEQPGTGRPDLPSDLWAWFNLKGDAAALIAHFVLGVLIIIIIEADVFTCCSRITCRVSLKEDKDLKLDDDVLAE